jgi:hypothetical protein
MGVMHQILPVQMVVLVVALVILLRLVLEIHHRYLHLREVMVVWGITILQILALVVAAAHLLWVETELLLLLQMVVLELLLQLLVRL